MRYDTIPSLRGSENCLKLYKSKQLFNFGVGGSYATPTPCLYAKSVRRSDRTDRGATMATPTFVGFNTHATESTTTELTEARASELLDAKNERIGAFADGRKRYELYGVLKGLGKFSYVLAKRAKRAGGNRATPTVFWVDGDSLRPCTKTTHRDKRARVRKALEAQGKWRVPE